MATSKVEVTEGTGTNLATHTISEDAATKHLTRHVPSHSDGTALTDATGIKISTSQLSALATTAQTRSAGFQLVDEPTDGHANIIDDAAFTVASTGIKMVGFLADETSTDSVNEGDGGAARITLDRKQIVTTQPHTAGGLSVKNLLDVDETDDDVKASAGQVYGFYAVNRATSPRYIRFYNTNTPTVGTTAHVLGPIEVPANASDHTAFIWTFGGLGIPFDTAISVAATTGFADNDTGAPSANDVIMCILYA